MESCYINIRKGVIAVINRVQVMEKTNEDKAKLELYRLIGEGYNAVQEKREITLDEMVRKIEIRRAQRG